MRNPDNWPVEHGVVKRVDPSSDGSCGVTIEGSFSFVVRAEEVDRVGRPPVAGESVTVLGGLGSPIRGIFIGGREYRYQTRDEAEAERQKWLAEYEERKQRAYDENIGKWIARKDALDEPFRARLDRFSMHDAEEFWRDSGEYELFICEQANKLYKLALTKADPEQWLEDFHNSSWEAQRVLFPDLDEGHSGNTFGGMVLLARAVVRGQDI